MEELIYEYIFEHFEVKGGITVFFDGRRVYYYELKKHLGDLFNLLDWEVDVYMTTCFYEKDGDFDYFHFMTIIKPVITTMPSGELFYVDFVYRNVDNDAVFTAYDMSRAIATQSFNLDLTPLDDNLDE